MCNYAKFRGLSLAALMTAALMVSAAWGQEDDFDLRLPPGGDTVMTAVMEDELVRVAMRMIADQTGWQIFCTSQAGQLRIVAFGMKMKAEDLFKGICRTRGLIYEVEGMSISVMTFAEHNEYYGGSKEVFQLVHAPAEQVAAALTSLLAAKKSGASAVALPEVGAVVVYDSPASLKALRSVVEKLDRPLETAVVPLENASASEVVVTLRTFVSSMGRISADQNSNQIVIREIKGRLDQLVQMAHEMDVEPTKVTREFPLANAECTTVAQYLADMFSLQIGGGGEAIIRTAPQQPTPQPQRPQPGSSQPASGRRNAGGAPGRNQPGRSQRSAAAPASAPSYARAIARRASMAALAAASSAQVGTVVADERTNSVWVTDTEARVDQIEKVVKELDRALDTKTFQFNYVDPAEISIKEKLAGVLLGSMDYCEVDSRTRTVTITATRERTDRALALMAEWDKQPQQVFITAKVLAVSRDHLLDLGVTYNVMVDNMDENVNTDIEILGSFPPIIPASPKASIRIGDLADDDFTILVEALESDSTTRLLSSPRVLVLDRAQAQFSVASYEPYTEAIIDGNAQTTTQSVQFKEVGVIFSVIPTITDDRRIIMDLDLEVSSLQEVRDGIPVVLRSRVTTRVLVADGRPLVVGGLISDLDITGVTKVPILGDLPLIGFLFRNKRDDRSQREIVLLVVPNIVGPLPLAAEPTLAELEDDIDTREYLEGEAGEGNSPAGAGMPSKGPAADDEVEDDNVPEEADAIQG